MSDNTDINDVLALLKASGEATTDLEALADFLLTAGPQGGLVFNAPNKSVKGLVMPLFIQDIREKKSTVEGGKTRFECFFVVLPFDDVVIAPDLGTKLNRFELDVFIETRVKMTLERQVAYLAGLSAAERGTFAAKREYDTYRTETTRLISGTKIKLTSWDGVFAHSNGVPFSRGEFAIAKGLYIEDKHAAAGEPSKYGEQWTLRRDVGTLEDDPMHTGIEAREQLFATLQEGNVLLNVGDANPLFSRNNESDDERLFREKREKTEKGPKAWEREKIYTNWLPKALRPYAKRLFVVPSNGTQVTAELLDAKNKIVIGKSVWSPDFISKGDQPKKTAAFQVRCQIFEEGKPIQVALLSVTIYEENLKRYGINNQEIFGAVAGSFIPRCDGMIAAMPSLANSHNMDESSLAFNKQNIDGTYPKGVAFGVSAYAEVFCIDLASGIIKGGYPITPACVSTILIHKYKSDDFTLQCPGEVALHASQNELNTGGKPPEVNLLESKQTSIKEMQDHYQFFFMSEKANDSEEMAEMVRDLTTLYPNDIVEKTSALILGEKVKGLEGWPVKIRASPLKWTIFAVRNDIAKAYMDKKAAVKTQTKEEIVAKYRVLVERRKAEEIRQKKIAAEFAALAELPPGALDGPGDAQKLITNTDQPQQDTDLKTQPDLPTDGVKRADEIAHDPKRQKVLPTDNDATDADDQSNTPKTDAKKHVDEAVSSEADGSEAAALDLDVDVRSTAKPATPKKSKEHGTPTKQKETHHSKKPKEEPPKKSKDVVKKGAQSSDHKDSKKKKDFPL